MSEIAWAIAVLKEHDCETFDRSLPGLAHPDRGWLPLPGAPRASSLRFARDRDRQARRQAAEFEVPYSAVRKEEQRMRRDPSPDEVQHAKRVLAVPSVDPVSPDNFERGQWKGTSAGMITPGKVRAWIDRNLRPGGES